MEEELYNFINKVKSGTKSKEIYLVKNDLVEIENEIYRVEDNNHDGCTGCSFSSSSILDCIENDNIPFCYGYIFKKIDSYELLFSKECV